MTPNWRAAERAGDDVGELVPVSGVTREPVRTRAARRCLPNRVLREPAVLRPTTVQMRCAANVLLVDVLGFGPPVSEPIAFLTLVTAP